MTKILIADDEPNIVTSLEFLMRAQGFQVRSVADGERAMAEIAKDCPDLILLDVMMPRLNGFDVCQRIRENPDWSDLRIVMLTAKGREIEASKGIAVGADLYITKPFSTRDLVDQVKQLLQG